MSFLEEIIRSPYVGILEMEIRLLLAAALGALIGLDREVKRQARWDAPLYGGVPRVRWFRHSLDGDLECSLR